MPYLDLSTFGELFLRMTFGALTFAHGTLKARSLRKFASAWGLPLPVAAAVMVVQLIGGSLIFLGFATQVAGLANAALNAAILYTLIFRSDEPFLAPGQHSWSIGWAYLAMAIAVAAQGSGPWSLDAIIR